MKILKSKLILTSLSTLFITSILTGCINSSSNSSEISEIDVLFLNATQRVKKAQHELFVNKLLNEPVVKETKKISNNKGEIKYTYIWKGDALQLLKKISADNEIRFISTGVEVSLPISLRAKNVTFSELISLIQSQINYRAQIIHNPSLLILDYNNSGQMKVLSGV